MCHCGINTYQHVRNNNTLFNQHKGTRFYSLRYEADAVLYLIYHTYWPFGGLQHGQTVFSNTRERT